MDDIKCSNTVCDNKRPVKRDPRKQWCDTCYPKRVDRQQRREREIGEEQRFFNSLWVVAKNE
tara:strand:+ start:234 stop:419 length:186 start_codon:yes stop_codon:yes gene_type:complete